MALRLLHLIALVTLDLSKGRYLTDSTGRVTGVTSDPPTGIQ
jgi:hypothetical protein